MLRETYRNNSVPGYDTVLLCLLLELVVTLHIGLGYVGIVAEIGRTELLLYTCLKPFRSWNLSCIQYNSLGIEMSTLFAIKHALVLLCSGKRPAARYSSST